MASGGEVQMVMNPIAEKMKQKENELDQKTLEAKEAERKMREEQDESRREHLDNLEKDRAKLQEELNDLKAEQERMNTQRTKKPIHALEGATTDFDDNVHARSDQSQRQTTAFTKTTKRKNFAGAKPKKKKIM
jgi:DNA repair exonuclease SbcCD ATPase subunit